MSAKAHVRMAADWEREQAEQAERWRLEAIAEGFGARAALLAAPPNPCPECYEWWPPTWWWRAGTWGHIQVAVKPGPAPQPPPDAPWLYRDTDETHWCYHECHGDEPHYTIPPVMALA